MVQLSDKSVVTTVIDKWKQDVLGGTRVRVREKQKPMKNLWGIAKGVPYDVEDHELTKVVQKNYNGCQATRMFKNNSEGSKTKLKAVKIKFNTNEAMLNTTKTGIMIDSCYTSVRVDEFSSRRGIVQCYKCWRYSHMSTICSKEETCRRCGTNHPDCDKPDTCPNPINCVNCHGFHEANQRSLCPKHTELRSRLDNRQDV